MNKKLKGTGVAIVTPFHKDGSIDFKSLGKLLNSLIENGITYIVTLGTTGESAALSTVEKNAVINYVTEVVEKRIPVVVGVGGNNTSAVLGMLKELSLDDVDAILSVCPYYNKPQQNGLYLHYKAIANNSPLPVILYNVPDRTGVNLKAETTLQLAHDFKNIIGIKEACKNTEQWIAILKDRPDNFMLLSGDDLSTMPMIALGGNGVISVTANAFPKEFSDMVNHCFKGEYKSARKIQYKLMEFTTSLFLEGSPGGIKASLEVLGICQNYLRLPNVPVSRSVYNTIKNNVNAFMAQAVV